MPLTPPVPDARTVAEGTKPDRDRAVDVARLAALVVVIFGHCALLLATIDSSGLWIGNLLGEMPALAPITWVVQVMPLFFLAGGAAGAYGWREGNAVGDLAIHPCTATVSSGVLVSRLLDGRPSGGVDHSRCGALLQASAGSASLCSGSSVSTS